MIGRHPAGHLWTLTCDSCGIQAVAEGGCVIDVATLATAAGWTVGTVVRAVGRRQ